MSTSDGPEDRVNGAPMANGQEEKEDIIEITESPSETSDVGSNDEDSSSGEEVDEGEEEDSDEDEDVDEEDEPALKYERIGGFIPDLFKKDSASALAISNGKTMVNTVCSQFLFDGINVEKARL